MRIMQLWALLLTSLFFSSASAQYYDDESEECVDAKDEAEDAARDLASYASSLQQCAENADFDDDCSSEFYDVQSAHSEYESATSDVSHSCED